MSSNRVTVLGPIRDETLAEALDFYTHVRDSDAELIADAKADERDRIRAELINWLGLPGTVVPVLPEEDKSWPVVDADRLRNTIDRICSKE